jgi:ketopantoate reductase
MQKLTPREIRKLCRANGQRGWQAIPEECPSEIKAGIIEWRARQLGINRAMPVVHTARNAPAVQQPDNAPQAEADALRERLNSVSLF